ncbi:MAG: hypothetical protein ABFS19_12575 [Thermodesulfobacteriota bacterium]
MVARLQQFSPGDGYRFLCRSEMAREMVPLISGAGGEIVEEDVRSYGVVMLVRKVE